MRGTQIATNILIGAATIGVAPVPHASDKDPVSRNLNTPVICAQTLEALGGKAIGDTIKLPGASRECIIPEKVESQLSPASGHEASGAIKDDEVQALGIILGGTAILTAAVVAPFIIFPRSKKAKT